MTPRPTTIVDRWRAALSADGAYAGTEAFSGTTPAWSLVAIGEQLSSGWQADVRSALAWRLSSSSSWSEADSSAALLLLCLPWPNADVTSSLNLLSLIHHVGTSDDAGLLPFLSRACIQTLIEALQSDKGVIVEQALNVAGACGRQLCADVDAELVSLSELLAAKLSTIDDADVHSFMKARIAASFSSRPQRVPIPSPGPLIARFETMTLAHRRALGDEMRERLNLHFRAVAWSLATDASAVHAVRISQDRKSGRSATAYAVFESWIAVVRELVVGGGTDDEEDSDGDGDDASFSMLPLEAAPGSLILTLRIDGRPEACERIAAAIREIGTGAAQGPAAEELGDALRSRHLRLRVTHVGASREVASADVVANDARRSPFGSHRLQTGEVPQANTLRTVFGVLDCLASGMDLTPENITAAAPAGEAITTSRQVQYYRTAARILGLLSTLDDELTRAGWVIHRQATYEERLARTRWLFESCACGQAWIEWSDGHSIADLREGTATQFLAERSKLGGQTVPRRASTLEQWRRQLQIRNSG